MSEEEEKAVWWDNNPSEVENYKSTLEEYQQFLGNRPHKFVNLKIADIVLSIRAALEVKRVSKTFNDIWRSLKDGSLHKQCQNMMDNYGWYGFIFQIEFENIDDMFLYEEDFKRQMFDTLCTTLEFRMGAHIFVTTCSEETIDLVYHLFESELKGPVYITPENKSPKPKTLEDEQIYFISSLPNTGYKKAKALLDYFETPGRILGEIIATKTAKTRTGKDKLVEKFPIPGFGIKWILKNQDLMNKRMIENETS